MRASLNFHLPEEEPEYLMATNGCKAFCVINRFKQDLHDHIKFDSIPENCKTPYEYAEYLKTHLWDLINEYGVSDVVDL